MDRFTVRNLELFHSNNPGGVALIDVLDQTLTSMGGRMLKHWLAFPLRDLKQIEERLDVVDILFKDDNAFETLSDHLIKMVDIERIVSKIATLKISPRALVQLGNSLIEIGEIKSYLSEKEDNVLKALGKGFLENKEVIELIKSTLKQDAPVSYTHLTLPTNREV